MEERELICIRCPMGCIMKVKIQKNEIVSITGNTCKRGDVYARKEVSNPTRTVTSTVLIKGGNFLVVPVKTKYDIPKEKIKECMEELRDIVLTPPIRIGDVILSNIAGTGVDVVATKDVE